MAQTLRLFLLPISTRHTLLYCERLHPLPNTTTKPPLTDRITTKAAETWSNWESKEKGWQKTVTNYGNQLFKRIPFQEWGLKSLPPLTKARKQVLEQGGLGFEVHFPGRFLKAEGVSGLLGRLATERQALSKKRMVQAVALMPVTIPVAILPVIPNLPFFYLVFRSWSHYRALYGGKMLEHALSLDKVKLVPSRRMDELYSSGLLNPELEDAKEMPTPSDEEMDRVAARVMGKQGSNVQAEDSLLLRKRNGKLIGETFHLPEMEVEIERAVEQVEKELEAKRLEHRKAEADRQNASNKVETVNIEEEEVGNKKS